MLGLREGQSQIVEYYPGGAPLVWRDVIGSEGTLMKTERLSSRHLVDPELAGYLDVLPSFDLRGETLADIRGRAPHGRPVDETPPENVIVTEMTASGRGDHPAVRVLVYRPNGASGPLPAFFHIHGGGYVMGAPESKDLRHRQFAADIGCVVVTVDYRLAPETPFPGPLEDCYTALRWLHEHAEGLGVDPGRIAIGGESAGGGLAAALALLARDRGEVPILFQILIYPMLDDRTGSVGEAAPHPYAGEFLWTRSNNRFGWEALLGETPGSDNVSGYAAPARATDLAGLPAAYIAVGALDLFIDENLEYGRRLIRAGVPTELHVYPGVFHGFDLMPAKDVKSRFERDLHHALRWALEPSKAE